MTEMLQAMHELIAVTRGKQADKWIGIEGVSDYLDMSVAHVRKDVITLPEFPRPARLNGVGHPRWLRSEVAAFMRSQQC